MMYQVKKQVSPKHTEGGFSVAGETSKVAAETSKPSKKET
jgi:hypothetical protein